MSITVGAPAFSTEVAGGTTCVCLSASGDVDHQVAACFYAAKQCFLCPLQKRNNTGEYSLLTTTKLVGTNPLSPSEALQKRNNTSQWWLNVLTTEIQINCPPSCPPSETQQHKPE